MASPAPAGADGKAVFCIECGKRHTPEAGSSGLAGLSNAGHTAYGARANSLPGPANKSSLTPILRLSSELGRRFCRPLPAPAQTIDLADEEV